MPVETDLIQARRAIVRAARELLTGELGVIEASRAISAQQHVVDPDMADQELLGFLGIDSQSDHLAVGSLLQEWHPSLREAKIREVAEFEDFFRDYAIDAARIIVERYASAA